MFLYFNIPKSKIWNNKPIILLTYSVVLYTDRTTNETNKQSNYLISFMIEVTFDWDTIVHFVQNLIECNCGSLSHYHWSINKQARSWRRCLWKQWKHIVFAVFPSLLRFEVWYMYYKEIMSENVLKYLLPAVVTMTRKTMNVFLQPGF